MEIRIKGRKSATRKKIGSVDLISLSDAQAEAKAMLADASKGIDFRYSAQEEEIKSETVGYALEQHLNEKRHALRDSTIRDYQKHLTTAFRIGAPCPYSNLRRNVLQTVI